MSSTVGGRGGGALRIGGSADRVGGTRRHGKGGGALEVEDGIGDKVVSRAVGFLFSACIGSG